MSIGFIDMNLTSATIPGQSVIFYPSAEMQFVYSTPVDCAR